MQGGEGSKSSGKSLVEMESRDSGFGEATKISYLGDGHGTTTVKQTVTLRSCRGYS